MSKKNIKRFLFVLMLLPLQAYAEQRCDCAHVQSSCSATVSIDNRWVDITSDRQECSRVDYLIEGQPSVSLVLGGEERVKWAGQPLMSPDIIVERCLVCWDSSVNSTADRTTIGPSGVAANDESSSDRIPSPIIEVLPSYPPSAWVAELEGYVVVEFTVSGDGTVDGARIVESTDAVFEPAALAAINRYRYQAALADGEPTAFPGLTERFSFSLEDGTSEAIVTKE